MKMLRALAPRVEQRLSDLLNGGVTPAGLARFPWLKSVDRAAHALCSLLFRQEKLRQPPEEGDTRLPDVGKPAPLQPYPGHHLVAAMALPPSSSVYLLPKD